MVLKLTQVTRVYLCPTRVYAKLSVIHKIWSGSVEKPVGFIHATHEHVHARPYQWLKCKSEPMQEQCLEFRATGIFWTSIYLYLVTVLNKQIQSWWGHLVNTFWISQGFQVGTVELIQKVYEATCPDMNAFMDWLAWYGYPITEVQFLYSFIIDE